MRAALHSSSQHPLFQPFFREHCPNADQLLKQITTTPDHPDTCVLIAAIQERNLLDIYDKDISMIDYITPQTISRNSPVLFWQNNVIV
jgi:hypothetical protein